ncbi:unnamed protein product [Prunus armeniaca]|uniref:BHLH domain-containing protein n=1 Tax=Prunus armeniaca TaxID=36596 RepID=A0A6J5WR00_PRUAR|nr:hypothetical protein GBA52_010748 [Prunus armeniaca]CAB4304146.1 unnamed protein product [Prunus armeniaca]
MALAKDMRMPHDSCTHESPQVSSDLSNGFVFRATSNYHQPDHQVAHSVINFKSSGYNSFFQNSESLLSFEKNSKQNILKTRNDKDEHFNCDDDLHHGNYQWNHTASVSDPRLSGDFNCFQTASNYSSMPNTSKDDHGDEAYGWLYSEATVVADGFQEPESQEGFHKLPHTGETMQPLKKQCTSSGTKKPKPKSSSPTKDPQSIAAKNRRERISERLKILQELVPNGCKVDLVTMLEKAISYVKFLQLQVKVLATDEFWPVQGGKAPDISQVKEAIDAILSSQRDTSSSSK